MMNRRSPSAGGRRFRERRPEGCARLLTIVRRFLGDEDVVDMAFALACIADANELCTLAQFREIGRADVAHPSLQSADQLFKVGGKGAAMGHAAFDAFGHELAFRYVVLAVAVAHAI